MGIDFRNIKNFKDRNGVDLNYGDKVLIKSWNGFSVAQIIGFTNKFVVLIYCVGCGRNLCRAPQNVIKVKNIEKLKHY